MSAPSGQCAAGPAPIERTDRAERCWRRPVRISAQTGAAPRRRRSPSEWAAPTSNAFWLIHLPVPFCCASSRMRSTSGLPVSASTRSSTLAVISTRYERSSPSFHFAKSVCHLARRHAGGAGQHARTPRRSAACRRTRCRCAPSSRSGRRRAVPCRRRRDRRLRAFAAIARRIGASASQASRGPPGIIDGPSQRPFLATRHAHADETEPAQTQARPRVDRCRESVSCRRRSRMSSRSRCGRRCAMTLSTGAPAGTIIRTRRGRSSTAINLSGASALPMPVPPACPAANACVLAVSTSYPATGNPLLAILRARFAPSRRARRHRSCRSSISQGWPEGQHCVTTACLKAGTMQLRLD